MIIIPFTHEKLTFKTVPYVSVTIVLISLLLVIISNEFSGIDPEEMAAAKAEYAEYYVNHRYLKLHPEFEKELSPYARKLYLTHRKWTSWYESSPEDAFSFMRNYPNDSINQIESPTVGRLLTQALLSPQGLHPDDRWVLDPEINKNPSYQSRVLWQFKIAKEKDHTLVQQQSELDSIWSKIEGAASTSFENRFGYIPSEPKKISLFTYPFFHISILQLILNMIIFWVAASSIEEIWGKLVFAGLFIFFSAIGAALYAYQNSEQTIPLTGCAVPVAGMMGAFIIRFAKCNVKFAYLYYVPAVPFRMGVWEMPAFFLMPVWFFLQLLFSLIFGFDHLFLIAQYGAFAAGMSVALIFDLTRFEEKVLGREYIPVVDDATQPLVAFNTPSLSPYASQPERPLEHHKNAGITEHAQPKTDNPLEDKQNQIKNPLSAQIDMPQQPETRSSLPPNPATNDMLPHPDKPKPATRSSMNPGGYLRTSKFDTDDTIQPNPGNTAGSPGSYSYTSTESKKKTPSTEQNSKATANQPRTSIPASAPASGHSTTRQHNSSEISGLNKQIIRVAVIREITKDYLSVVLPRGIQLQIPLGDVSCLSLAQINNIETQMGAALHFAGSGRRTAKVISLVRNDRNTPEHNFIFIVDCERLKFNTLLPAALYRNNLSENIQLLFEYLTQLLPKALTHKTRAPRTSKGFPLYEDFESLIQSCNQ